MHYFKYRKNELFCEEVRVQDIIERFGTPCYIYSYRTIIEHFHKIAKAFIELEPLICYSMKANSNLAICRILVNEGAGLDIVSGGELFRALCVGADGKKIVFAGVGKTDNEIKEAIKAKILFFNVESEPELERIQAIAVQMHKVVNACIRINVGVNPNTHSYITTAIKDSKFGVSFAVARKILRYQNRFFNINIRGLHFHIGSQITEVTPYVEAIKKITLFIEGLKKDGIRLEYLNIGGGMGINYKNDDAKTARALAEAIVPLLKKTGLKIILEPGRFIVGSAGILVTKVTYLKNTEYRDFIILDSAMNDLIRPTLYQSYHEIIPLNNTSTKTKKYDVVGSICESGDFFAKDRDIPLVKQGDYLAIMCAGAYGFSMSSNYNSRLKPAEVLVKDGSFYLIRKRQTYEDLIDNERIPLFLKDKLPRRLKIELKRKFFKE